MHLARANEVKAIIESLWIILTVLIPAIVFYGTLRILLAVLGIDHPFLGRIDESETLITSILFVTGFTIQFFGIVAEDVAFKFGPYKHKDPKYQEAFDKRYEIIATMDPEENYHVERILGMFYMSHNIAIGMFFNSLWAVFYAIAIRPETVPFVAASAIVIVTLVSIYIPINRFGISCKILYAYLHPELYGPGN